MTNPIDIIGVLSSVETLAGLRSILSDIKEHTGKALTDQKLNLLDTMFREQIQRQIKEESVSEKLDDFFAAYIATYKPSHMIDLLSQDERLAFQREFYQKYPDLISMKSDLNPLIERFLDLLNESLNEKLDYNTKLLLHQVNATEHHLSQQIQDVATNQNPSRMKSGIKLLTSMEAVLTIIRLHTGHDFDTKVTLPLNYLTYSDLNDFILKAHRIFSKIDRDKINATTTIDSGTPLESLQIYVSKTAPDFALNLNRFFADKIMPVIAFLKAYDDKTPEYYWAIGKMDCPINDYDKILTYLIDSLENLFCCQYECLKNKWKNHDYEKMDSETVLQMQKQVLKEIQTYLEPPCYSLIQEIYGCERITDRELAVHNGMSVEKLRHLLYAATKSFLTYEYVDDATTMLSIKWQYRKAISYYFEQEAIDCEM